MKFLATATSNTFSHIEPPSRARQVLSGRAKLDKNTEKAGEITYNGQPLSKLNAKRIAAYIAEQREHLANLTVRETCEFARDCTDAGNHKNKDAAELKQLVGDAIAEGQVRRVYVLKFSGRGGKFSAAKGRKEGAGGFYFSQEVQRLWTEERGASC